MIPRGPCHEPDEELGEGDRDDEEDEQEELLGEEATERMRALNQAHPETSETVDQYPDRGADRDRDPIRGDQ